MAISHEGRMTATETGILPAPGTAPGTAPATTPAAISAGSLRKSASPAVQTLRGRQARACDPNPNPNDEAPPMPHSISHPTPKTTRTARIMQVPLFAFLAAALPALAPHPVNAEAAGELAVVEGEVTQPAAPLLPEVIAGVARDLAPHVASYDPLKAEFEACAAAAADAATGIALDSLVTEPSQVPTASGANETFSLAACHLDYHEGKVAVEQALQDTALASEATLLAQVETLTAEAERKSELAESTLREAEALGIRQSQLLDRFQPEAERLLSLPREDWTREDTMSYGAFVREATAIEMLGQAARQTSQTATRDAEQYRRLAGLASNLGTQLGEWGRDRTLSVLASQQTIAQVQSGAQSLVLTDTTQATLAKVAVIIDAINQASRSDPAQPAAIIAGGTLEPMPELNLSTPDVSLLADIYARSGKPLDAPAAETAMVEGE